MKKIFIIIFFIALLIISFIEPNSLEAEKQDNEIIITNSNISNKKNYSINYPKSSKIEIDNFIENEVMDICERVINNYYPLEVFVEFSYKTFTNNNNLSYLFTIKIEADSEVIKVFKKTYNFDIKTNQQIILDEKILEDIYLPIINKNLEKYQLKLNKYDLKLVNYLINDNNITFIIPSEVTNKSNLELVIENKGVEYKSVFSRNQSKMRKYVALTFDDGPSTKTKELVNLLNKYDVKATFFLLGERVKYYPDEVLYISKFNHEIGNHSYTHPNFKILNINDINEEINKTQNAIYELTKSYPKIFRFPYGSYDTYTLDFINLPVILWNADSEDWRYLNNNIIINNVINNLTNKSVILFHDFSKYRKEAIENVIIYLKNEGYEFVTVSELYEFSNIENMIYGKIYN